MIRPYFRLNVFFDQSPEEAAAAEAAKRAADEAARKAADEEAALKKRTYSQEEIDKILENEKKSRKEETNKLIGELETLKRSRSLSDAERSSLQERIDDINKSMLTKEELAKQERERLEKEKKDQHEQLSAELQTWKTRFENTMIERSIRDAAVKANTYSPDTFIALHRGDTFIEEVLNESGKSTGQFAVKTKVRKEENGIVKDLVMTPDELVKYMKEKPDQYGFLFKGEKQGGMGGGNIQKPIGEIDWKNLTPEQYAKVRNQVLG